ncbi:MAG TPA: nucleosidase [Marmoricola sp.]|nr:nucleosidase [Marmoricola sp.]
MSVLVVAATRAEASYFPDRLPVVLTGLGKTAAATAVAKALAETRGITEVVNVGTAGALHDGLEGLYFPGRVLNHDLSADAIKVLGYDPMEDLTVGSGDPEIVLASGDVFVTDPKVRALVARRAQLVDMEGYAVVWACRAFDVPVRLVKHVSDNADEGAMDWPTLVDRSARVLGEWLADHC